MEDNKKQEQEEVKTEEKVEQPKEEVKAEEQPKEEVKKPPTEEKVEESKPTESDDRVKKLEEQLNALLERDKQRETELQSAVLRNTIMEKVQDKEIQKAVLDSNLVKSPDDIEKVLKIVELSKTQKTNRFTDGYVPIDVKPSDEYAQAEKKGDIFSMIKNKMSKQN